ncbi:MAG: putative transposase [Glaciecola sp.]|jgi:putative transposase
MPREARIGCAGYPYHVTQRGNFQMNVFEDDEDKHQYMEFFMFYKNKFQVKLYAWCLMDNHVHFIVEPSTEKGLAQLFSFTHMRYSQYFNKKKGVKGHLWQGRFFSCPLDVEHLYEAVRYVELNPKRAGMVKRIDGYRWSSLLMHLKGKGEFEVSPISDYLDIENWKDYLNEKVNDDMVQLIKSTTKANRPAGNSIFIGELEKITGRSFSFNKKGRPKKEKREIK